MIDCPMCAYRFEEAECKTGCSSCILSKGCHQMKCPRCGYEIPRESGVIKFIKNWGRKKRGTG